MTLFKNRRSIKSSVMPAILAILLTVMFGSSLIALFMIEIPGKNESSLLIMFGSLQTAWILSMNYYYISTQGSKAKDQLLADAMPVQRNDTESN